MNRKLYLHMQSQVYSYWYYNIAILLSCITITSFQSISALDRVTPSIIRSPITWLAQHGGTLWYSHIEIDLRLIMIIKIYLMCPHL